MHDETTFVTDDDGRPAFLQGVLMDITERKLAEQALREIASGASATRPSACARSTR